MSVAGGARKPPDEGRSMVCPTPTAQRAEGATVARTAGDLAALSRLTGPELAEKYLLLFGQPARSRNKVFLRKRLAWRIQELAEGGLSERALARIEELGADALASSPLPAEAIEAHVIERLRKVTAAGTALGAVEIETSGIARCLADLDGTWDLLTPENRGRLLRAVVQSVEVDEPANKMKVVLVNLDAGLPVSSAPPFMEATG